VNFRQRPAGRRENGEAGSLQIAKRQTLIANGELKGKLWHMHQEYSQQITGKEFFPKAFPLLINFWMPRMF